MLINLTLYNCESKFMIFELSISDSQFSIFIFHNIVKFDENSMMLDFVVRYYRQNSINFIIIAYYTIRID